MADRRAGGGARGGGRNDPAGARPHGPRDVEQVGQGARDNWLEKNPNRVVVEKKVNTATKYKSEHTVTKTKNKELQELYDELVGYHAMISRAPSGQAATDALEEYRSLMKEVDLLTALIKKDKGMPLALPSKLKKAPKPRAVV